MVFDGKLGWFRGGGGLVAVFVYGVRCRGPRHDEVAQGRRGGEDAVVGELVLARVRRHGDEALDENERVKAKGLGAVGPGGPMDRGLGVQQSAARD